MADSQKPNLPHKGRQGDHRDYKESRNAARALDNLQLTKAGDDDNDDSNDDATADKTTTMAPPTHRGSKSTRARKASLTQHQRATIDGLALPKLPKGVTPEMVKQQLDRIHKSRQPLPTSSQPRAPPAPQVEIDSHSLPCELSVFYNRRLSTRGIIFNLVRLNSIKTIKTIINTYFAYEFKRIGLPNTVSFAGIQVIYHRSSNSEDVVKWGAFMTEAEYQLCHAELIDGETTTGQLVRAQILLYTDEQLAEDQDQLRAWFEEGEYDAMLRVNGPKWIMEFPQDLDNPLTDTRTFEKDADESQTITIPAYTYRENVEKARLGEAYRDHFSAANIAKAKIRNTEYDLRQAIREEIRGLRRMLREHGVDDIQLDFVNAKAKEAKSIERGGKVKYTGETQDWNRLRVLGRPIEDKSDATNVVESSAFDRAFLNI